MFWVLKVLWQFKISSWNISGKSPKFRAISATNKTFKFVYTIIILDISPKFLPVLSYIFFIACRLYCSWKTGTAVKGGKHLIEMIRAGRLDNKFLSSCDAVALYPSIIFLEGLELLEMKIKKDKTKTLLTYSQDTWLTSVGYLSSTKQRKCRPKVFKNSTVNMRGDKWRLGRSIRLGNCCVLGRT